MCRCIDRWFMCALYLLFPFYPIRQASIIVAPALHLMFLFYVWPLITVTDFHVWSPVPISGRFCSLNKTVEGSVPRDINTLGGWASSKKHHVGRSQVRWLSICHDRETPPRIFSVIRPQQEWATVLRFCMSNSDLCVRNQSYQVSRWLNSATAGQVGEISERSPS